MNKLSIHQFENEIYPFKLWIAITKDLTPLKERLEGNEIDFDLDDYNAITCYVTQKEPPHNIGALVIFPNKKAMSVANMAHEAAHISDYLWQHISEYNPGEEANAYIVGWAADCMNQTRLNKFK